MRSAEPKKWFSSDFTLHSAEGRHVGEPTVWYKRGARIELAERLPPVLKVFAVWLALLLWK